MSTPPHGNCRPQISIRFFFIVSGCVTGTELCRRAKEARRTSGAADALVPCPTHTSCDCISRPSLSRRPLFSFVHISVSAHVDTVARQHEPWDAPRDRTHGHAQGG